MARFRDILMFDILEVYKNSSFVLYSRYVTQMLEGVRERKREKGRKRD